MPDGRPELQHQRRLKRFSLDSFRPSDANRHLYQDTGLTIVNSVTSVTNVARGWGWASFSYYDLGAATAQSADTGLARKLKGRHLQMIAIGGAIGTGLFVASGRALQAGGPASLLIAFSVVGVMLFCTCQALGELAVIFPISGSFSSWATRFLDPSWGFAMGWTYALQWLITLPIEIIAASLTIRYWTGKPPSAIFVTVFLVAIIFINLFGIKGYGEAESFFSIIKVIAVIGFILLGIVLNCAGTPDRGYIGGEFWRDPGAFNNGLGGLCSVFATAAFAYSGTELIGLAAAETANPRKSIPAAIKQVFWRITIFYVAALTLVGLLVPHDNPRLLDANSSVDARASPFVIAIEMAEIQVLPSVMNAVILVSVLSVGNSAIFGSSRTLAALANLNQAPKLLGYVDKAGRPLVAIALAATVGLLAYLADVQDQGRKNILNWLVAISGLSTLLVWGTITLCHIRFRRAWAYHGRCVGVIPFTSQAGIAGSYLGLSLNILALCAQFWVAAFPIGWDTMSAREVAKEFFLGYMSLPVILLLYILHKVVYKTQIVRIREMDIDTGRRSLNLPTLLAKEKQERALMPRWKRLYKFMC
ncbi:general amino-acid permease GAP1 [Pochonia chlamydosporia 170]|uniref:General amino-acid permease GAP1 n=1 Tax=Pochonia chlamydosporia 170 TaxID=1380566 RepID=A0A179F2Z5_METCM|nr:general amino-acid permease GAP1 [Pochonia chlamydosporia 170]OAQ59449.1 general amino-acid permease GAP1 [Pochonia chlamydosporia 170]